MWGNTIKIQVIILKKEFMAQLRQMLKLKLKLKLNNNYLNSDVIKDNCDFLADNIFDTSPIMKMRDDVALRLFSGDTVNTIIALHNQEHI